MSVTKIQKFMNMTPAELLDHCFAKRAAKAAKIKREQCEAEKHRAEAMAEQQAAFSQHIHNARPGETATFHITAMPPLFDSTSTHPYPERPRKPTPRSEKDE